VTSTTKASSTTGSACEHTLVVARQQRAVDTERKPDTGRGGPSERFDEPVVASTAAECVLCGVERAALDLEDRSPVVVEAANEFRLDRERDVEGPKPREHRGEVSGRVVAVEVGDLRCGGDVRLVGVTLRVEYPQWVAHQGGTALFAQRIARGGEVVAQGLDVAATVVGLAETVDEQRDLAQAEPGEEFPGECDHLDVEVRVVGAEDFHTDLVELAVAPALWFLVAEVRPGVEDLPRCGRPVLGEGTTDAGGHLRAQRDVPVALVDEVVHLLGDDRRWRHRCA
jgi:hypothetical protein